MSEILDSMNDLARSLHEVGAMDENTMKAIDVLCRSERHPLNASEIRAIRKKASISQPAFAALIGVSTSTIVQWENGAKQPGGPAARLLDIANRKGIDAIT